MESDIRSTSTTVDSLLRLRSRPISEDDRLPLSLSKRRKFRWQIPTVLLIAAMVNVSLSLKPEPNLLYPTATPTPRVSSVVDCYNQRLDLTQLCWEYYSLIARLPIATPLPANSLNKH